MTEPAARSPLRPRWSQGEDPLAVYDAPPAPPSAAGRLRAIGRDEWRRALLLAEILSPPLSRRPLASHRTPELPPGPR